MWLAALIVVALGIQITWTCRSIRREFGERGLHISRIRWEPLKHLVERRWTRWQMLYRVWYVDRRREPFTCLVVCTLFQGFTTENPERDVVAARSQRKVGGMTRLPWLAIGCAFIGCAAIGFEYWTTPYHQLNLPDGLIGPGLLLVAALSGLLQFLDTSRWRSTLLIMTLAPVATVIVRIAVDLAHDPTSHNLFPFELVIAGFVGAATAALGTGIGGFIRRVAVAERASRT